MTSSYATDFHDITSGTSGSYSAVTGYDLVTGWGSPNGTGLITALAGPSTPGFSLSASPTSVSVVQGSSGTSTITSTVTGGFDSAITLTASGQPTGVTVSFRPNFRLPARAPLHDDDRSLVHGHRHLYHHRDGNLRQHHRNHQRSRLR